MSSSTLQTLLGVRQAEIMRYLWAKGSATVRELHEAVAIDGLPTYTTVLSLCSRLREKGIIERRRVAPDDHASRAKQAFVYTPCLTEAALLRRARPAPPPIRHHIQPRSERAAIENLLAYLGTLQDAAGQPIEEHALDTILALLERAESVERAILIYQAEALHALHRAEVAEQRMATNPLPKPARAKPTPSAAVYDYQGNMCRVCGRPAPPSCNKRLDDFGVCSLDSCRQEARRRDNVAKQRRSVAHRRAQQA